MVTEEQRTLMEMLSYLHLPELPAPLNAEKVWAKACVKVVRRNGSEDYVIAEHDLYSWKELRILKEFGSMGQPVDVKAIYPLYYLEKEDVPSLSSREEIVKWVSAHSAEEEDLLSAMSDKKLQRIFSQVLIKICNHKHKNDVLNRKEEEEIKAVIAKEKEDSAVSAITFEEAPVIDAVVPDEPVLADDSNEDIISDKKKPGRKPRK